VSSEIFFFLKDHYDGIKAPVDSLIRQLKEVEVSTKTKNLMESFLRYENFVDKPLYLRCSWLPGSDPNGGMVIGDWELQQSG